MRDDGTPDMGTEYGARDVSLRQEQRELRSGNPPWHLDLALFPPTPITGGTRCDVAVIGSGITGSLAAEALVRAGYSVIIVDRLMPGRGSTAASTAMLQWEIDTSLTALSAAYGFEKAARIYRRSEMAVRELGILTSALGLPCNYTQRATLYLGGGDVGFSELAEEYELRQKAGLPGDLLDRGLLHEHFRMDRPGAILSPGSAEADPLRLAMGVLSKALVDGALLVEDEVMAYDWSDSTVFLSLRGGGQIEARHAVLATGYTMPDFVTSDLHRTVSSWCIATAPQPVDRLWRDRVLIWEASHPYLYARTTSEGRILVGGEDETTADVAERERLMPDKTARILAKIRDLWPNAQYDVEYSWGAEFGETQDGLPLIGRVPGAPRFFAAYGYGGNGITFSYMASRMLVATLCGETRPWFEDFALNRDVSPTLK